MTEKEKQKKGMFYQANAPEVLKDLYHCENECYEINQIPPSRREECMERLRKLFGKAGNGMFIVTPFFCDYGYNIEVGENFFANTNCVILDEAKVTFGDNVFIAPIHVGNNVWIGGNVGVVPGVTIGDNTTIGAGSVVTHDIPSGVLAAGNPCKVIRKLEE